MKKIIVAAIAFLCGLVSYLNQAQAANKPVQTIWHQVPFVENGDLAQYQTTMRENRNSVRQDMWNSLMSSVNQLAEKGVMVESIIGSMANILLTFDQLHDAHKAQDALRINESLENQFKAQVDNLFLQWDVRDQDRKFQFSAKSNVLLNKNSAMQFASDTDYISYATFSNIGAGNFQLTLHLVAKKDGANRAFIARGPLLLAVGELAQQLFDFFQKNQYPDWKNPQQLEWLPTPANPTKSGYTFSEAKQYCQIRGYRLPFTRELLIASSGSQYKEGGIGSLLQMTKYAVADQTYSNINYWYVPGLEQATGGPIQPDFQSIGTFWCVKGAASEEVQFVKQIWHLIRQHRGVNNQVYRALETIRYEIGDMGATESFFAGTTYLTKMNSIEEALKTLKANQISIKIPASLQ